MNIYEKFTNIIRSNISSGKTRFAICMFGRNGILFKDLLNNQYGINEEIIIDNELCLYNKKIISLSEVKYLQEKVGLQFVITSNVKSFVYELEDYVNIDQIHNPFSVDKEVNIGKYSYGPLVDALKAGALEIEKIGSFCSFAQGCCAVWNHPINLVTTHEFTYSNTHCSDLGILYSLT